MAKTTFKALFIDIGGVLLTNGWDRSSREKAADHFKIDFAEMEKRHALAYDIYESGKISLQDYLDLLLFYQQRPFSAEEFEQFMRSLSQPFPDMLAWVSALRKKSGLKCVLLSNEGRDLMEYRIEKFELSQCADFFVCSAFVHLRKPDPAIYQLPLDLIHAQANQVIYLDDRPLLVETGEKLGFCSLQHINFETTKKSIENLLNL